MLSFSAQLSQTLVAFTIELDNEFEHQTPHRTTNHGAKDGSRQGPWLASVVMWSTCMRFVGAEGVSVRELERLARTPTNLNGMERWGYVTVAPDPADRRPKPPRSDWVIRATAKGRKAREIWQPLFRTIEERWQARFGKDEIDPLRESLAVLVRKIDVELPDCLPILGYGLYSRGPETERPALSGDESADLSDLSLLALLSRALLAFALEFERESELSLAISANVLRVLEETGVRVRDLPLLSGVSKEAISMAMGILQKRHLALVETDPAGSRAKIARLTPKGREAQDAYRTLLGVIEKRWRMRFGADTLRTLQDRLARLSPLFLGLEPYPDGWRASVRKPGTLPHYPMVLHRGGFPDGS